MFYKTLHWYVLRELLRIFLMTASALTTLLAFGGMFKPLTKEGVDAVQLLSIMANLMPAMLAYAIPIAALFAAVLVYWRLSTDNELTACRAGGISFMAVLSPALVLGLAVASVDLVFVQYVVPMFLQRTERAVRRDIGALLVNNIGRQEAFTDPSKRLVVFANNARQVPGNNTDETVVELAGMAATPLSKNGRPTAIVVARVARITIRELPASDEAQINVALTDASVFDPKTFRKISGNLTSLTPDRPLTIPSQFKGKPKFLSYNQLQQLNENPDKFPAIRDLIGRISQKMKFEALSAAIYRQWQAGHGTLNFALGGAGDERAVIHAPQAGLSPDRELTLAGAGPGKPLRVEMYRRNELRGIYLADTAALALTGDELTPTSGTLELQGDVKLRNPEISPQPLPVGDKNGVPVVGLEIPKALEAAAVADLPAPTEPLQVVKAAIVSDSPAIQKLAGDTREAQKKLDQMIRSELHSRGSFALSCLTLVLLGAALGVMMRGRNPLAVFVVGFVPSIVLVLLITAGRRMVEGPPSGVVAGIWMIWMGNLILAALVAGVYAKLLRQ